MLTRWRPGRPGRAGAAEAKALGRELEQLIENATRDRMTDMARAFERLDRGWQARLQNDATFVLELASIRHAIRDACDYGVTPQSVPLRFQASTLYIRDSHALLTGDPQGHERLHLVSGTVSEDGVRVLSRIVPVDTDQASAAYVRADARSTHNKIVELVERDGHQLMGMWHSHIMHGANSTRPSGVDSSKRTRYGMVRPARTSARAVSITPIDPRAGPATRGRPGGSARPPPGRAPGRAGPHRSVGHRTRRAPRGAARPRTPRSGVRRRAGGGHRP